MQIRISSLVPQRHSALPTLSHLLRTHHTVATEGHSALERCVLCRAVNKSIKTTAADIELHLGKVFLNTKKVCLKRVCWVIQQKTRPLATLLILFRMLIYFLKLFFVASNMVHVAILKLTGETWQAFWQIFRWEWVRKALKSFVVRSD